MSLDGGAKKAAKIASQTADKNNAIAADVRTQNLALSQPTVDRGNAAGSAYNALLGLGGDAGAAQQAFGNYQNSTGYDFRLGQGTRALDASAAAKGGLLSGAAGKALTTYGQNIGSAEFGNYLGQLGNQQNAGLNALGQATGTNNTYLSANTANNNNASQAAQDAARAKAAGLNSLIGTGIGLASSFATPGAGSFLGRI